MRTCALAVAAGLLLAAAPARAADPTKAECVDAFERAQTLQQQHKLIEARASLLVCAQASCPREVQQDCGNRVDQATRAQPTIAFSVKDGAGNDRTDVRVSVDGHVLAERLGGAAFEVDPGEHTFTFTSTGPPEPELTRRLVIVEGDKGRREVVVLGAAPAPVPAVPPPAPPAVPTPETPQGHPTQRLVGILSMGVGGAGLVVGSIFGALTLSNVSTQKTDCSNSMVKGGCPLYGPAASAHSAALTDGAVSTAAFIAGGVLVVTGATLFFTAGRSDAHPAHAILAPNVDAHGAGLLLRGSFW